MEYFYEVFVASNNFHGGHALTYCSERVLEPGQIVRARVRSNLVLGIIKARVKRPQIKVKPLEIINLPLMPIHIIHLLRWMQKYYPAPLGPTVQLFTSGVLTDKVIEKFKPLKYFDTPKSNLPTLTDEQKNAVQKLQSSGAFLLHGDTGSGKTRIYQELALQNIKLDESVLILSPEIGLSSQLFDNFKQSFGNRAILFHSGLTPAERRQAWLEILTAKEPLVIIGARSALFLPIKTLGLIVIDEAHDSAYKQEQAPYYNAIRVAGKLAQLHQAPLLLGTATPTVTDYYIAEQKKAQILRLSQPAIKYPTKVNIKIVDLKNRSSFNKSPHLSDELIKSMGQALEKNEQILLFLNRRGTARAVICQNCGWQALCQNCDTPLIYHGDSHNLICHVCNSRSSLFSSCPSCHGVDILFKSAGTKAIVEEVGKAFPSAKVMRFDADNLKNERFEQNYHRIKNGEIDVLVGTQTLAKGLDLPSLSLVGVVTADSGLFIPDYLAQERTYQLISQVIGRVGRGHRDGKVIIQTYNPDGDVIKDVLNKNWPSFYAKELDERQKFQFPPFFYLLRLSCHRASPASAQRSAEKLADQIANDFTNVLISGPAPAYHEKQGSKYEWQIIIKSKNRQKLTDIIKTLPSGWNYDIDPLNLL